LSETLAVYGGSFDPPHVAHTLVCAYALAAHELDRVLVVPTLQHAFDKPLAPYPHRLHMCRIAMRDLRRVEVSDLERDLPSPSLTLRTLERVHELYPSAALRFVIGSDLLPETPTWHRFDRIEQLAPLLIVPRAGRQASAAAARALPDISSTEIRRRLRGGEDTSGLLDPQVAAYAVEHGLYTTAQE
jgi:nicotinate-nucleotide adenylyltransferase